MTDPVGLSFSRGTVRTEEPTAEYEGRQTPTSRDQIKTNIVRSETSSTLWRVKCFGKLSSGINVPDLPSLFETNGYYDPDIYHRLFTGYHLNSK